MKKIFIFFILIFLFSCESKVNNFLTKVNIEEGKNNFYTEDMVSNIINDTDKVRVALLLPLSGPYKSYGEILSNTAQLSLFENKKKKLLLKIYDTEGTDFGANKAINKAVYDGVDVVVGPLFNYETEAIKKVIKKNNILAFTLSSDQKLANIDNIFVTGSTIEQEIQLLVSYLNENDIHNYVSFMPNNAFGADTNKFLRTTILGKDSLLIKSDYYDIKDENLMTKLSDLVNYYEVPQTIYEEYQKKKIEQKLLGNNTELQFLVKEEEKIYPQCLFIAEGGKNAEQLASFLFILQRSTGNIQLVGTSKFDGDNNILNNPYLNGAVFIGANPKKLEDFYNEYYKVYQEYPIKIATILYDIINVIDKIYKETNNNRVYLPDKTVLLDPFGFDGIDGKFRFLPNGIVERNMFVLQIKDKKKIVLDNVKEFLNY